MNSPSQPLSGRLTMQGCANLIQFGLYRAAVDKGHKIRLPHGVSVMNGTVYVLKPVSTINPVIQATSRSVLTLLITRLQLFAVMSHYIHWHSRVCVEEMREDPFAESLLIGTCPRGIRASIHTKLSTPPFRKEYDSSLLLHSWSYCDLNVTSSKTLYDIY